MAVVIIAVNLAGWGLFITEVLPSHFHYKGLGIGIGLGITAWTLGMRHAFDADHISAIDNVTRKLMADGQRPLGTGFFFAIGHSTIIVIVGVGLSIASSEPSSIPTRCTRASAGWWVPRWPPGSST
jgi:high-affinity nickel-transport protein